VGKLNIKSSHVVFWDVGGQEGIRTIWEKYFADAHAIMFVLDSANPQRVAEACKALTTMLKHQDLTGAPLLVLANKQDLKSPSSSSSLSSSSLTGGGISSNNNESKSLALGDIATSVSSAADEATKQQNQQQTKAPVSYVLSASTSSMSSSSASSTTAVTIQPKVVAIAESAARQNEPRHVKVLGISALKGTGVADGMDWLLGVLPNCARTKRMGTDPDE
jgi:GTPase SAR1 family protein